jgi:hypothetical protein
MAVDNRINGTDVIATTHRVLRGLFIVSSVVRAGSADLLGRAGVG